MPLLISGSTSRDYMPLSISGSTSEAYMPLYINSFTEQTMPLVLFANYDTRTLFLKSGYSSDSSIPLFMNNGENFNAIPLHITSGMSTQPHDGFFPLSIKNTQLPLGEISLYVDGVVSRPTDNNLNLFLQQGAAPGGIGHLYLTIEGKRITLYPDRSRSSNGFIPSLGTIILMISREKESSYHIMNMYTSGITGVSSFSTNSSMPLSIKTVDGSSNDSLSLYILGPNPLEKTINAYIFGE
jgi:hypothetical protein|tara:strand:- start:80 stop:799 length:720 start_codon:yes stop_codon:yes gene_type:complete